MKALVAGIHVLFAGLLAAALVASLRLDDGLVEEDYFGKAAGYLALKEDEERIGLSVSLPERIVRGRNRLRAAATTAAGPLTGARATLRAARLRGRDGDVTFPMQEEAPGVYAADALIPEAGTWLLTLTIDGGGIHARRRRLISAAEAPRDPDGPADIHAGPVRLKAPGGAVILEVLPRPVRAMRELLFAVTLPDFRGPGSPRIDLGMPGMRMPPNRVALVRGPDGSWRGKGVIVRCAIGRRTWAATVTLPDGSRAEAVFDVAD